MFTILKNKNFFLRAKFFEKLFFLLPFSLILGNVAINLNIFLIIISFFYEQNTELKKKYKQYKIRTFYLILVIIFFLLNIIYSNNSLLSIRGFLGIVKYILFLFIFIIFLEKKENLKNLSFIFFLTFNFVLLDTVIQYFLGHDIFGYPKIFYERIDLTSSRLSGPFGDELIVGSYLKNIFFISICWLLLFIKNNYVFFCYLIITLLTILLSGERASSIMFLFFCVLLISFYNFSIKKKTLIFLVLFFTFFLFFLSNEDLRKSSFDRTFKQLGIKKSEISYKKHQNFFDSQWGAHYLTAIEIFKDNKLIGSGVKNFRVVCSSKKYENINSFRANVRCATHPHNIYLEILSEIGLLGFILFISSIFVLIKIQIHKTLISDTNNYPFQIGIFVVFIMLMWPLQTTGSFFSTFNGFFYWFYAAIILTKKNYA